MRKIKHQIGVIVGGDIKTLLIERALQNGTTLSHEAELMIVKGCAIQDMFIAMKSANPEIADAAHARFRASIVAGKFELTEAEARKARL